MTALTILQNGNAAPPQDARGRVIEEEILPLNPDGYVQAWLVAGPQEIPVLELDRFDAEQPRPEILENYHRPELPLQEEPAEGETLEVQDLHGDGRFEWKMVRCGADRFLDHTTFGYNCHYLRTWAFTNVRSLSETRRCSFVITANGPADVWINGTHVYSRSAFNFQIPGRELFFANLERGDNLIVVAYSVVAIRECPYVLALQIKEYEGAGRPIDHCQTRLRTLYPLAARHALQSLLDAAAIDRPVYSGSDRLVVQWPFDMAKSAELEVRLQSDAGEAGKRPLEVKEPLAEEIVYARKGTCVDFGEARKFPNGRYAIVLIPRRSDAGHFYRKISFTIANGAFATEPSGTPEERAREGLIHAARANDFYGQIAKMALGRWSELRLDKWEGAFRRLSSRGDCSDFYLMGMLGALFRYQNDPEFPQELKVRITRTALDFRYWRDEPGCDAMCFHTENHQILFHACEVLAGQLFPSSEFTNTGKTGEWHREKGERLATAWLEKRAAEGFQEWDSNVYFEVDVAALTHLADLSANPDLATLAAMVLDKLLLTVALNSFKGVFGSTHGRVYSQHIKGGRQELTSGICRILWGTGVFNDHTFGIVSVGCARKYQLPPAIREIALVTSGPMWNRERHAGVFSPDTDCREGEWEVNKVSFKTRDFMLCSAQDLLPGKPGNQQHIWQATFGPDAVVFSTHPVCMSEDSARRPNFWNGNGILPRVAQWKDFLVVLCDLPADDWMGFTHAYFPVIHFDEWSLREGWMFARKGSGYIALHAGKGLELMATETGALDELRSIGVQNVWICQMGCAETDGSFSAFQEQISGMALDISGLSVHTRTIRGDEISFSWEGALSVNGCDESIKGFKHYDNPHCSAEIGDDKLSVISRHHSLALDFRGRKRDVH